MSSRILVIGAINIDLTCTPKSPLQLHDSNLATVDINIGGVGGNICQNLARLGHQVALLTVFGTDTLSQTTKHDLETFGIDTSSSIDNDLASPNWYISVLNQDGDMHLAVNDMASIAYLDVASLKEQDALIQSFDTIVLDNNLTQDALVYLAETYRDKYLIIDAVSGVKATKLIPVLPYISLVKVNELEYTILNDNNAFRNTDNLSILHSNQDQPIALITPSGTYTKEIIPCNAINSTSGAGDALLSGFIHGVLQSATIDQQLDYARQLAYQTLLVTASTNKEVSL